MVTYPSGMEVSYTRDATGQISGITIDGENLTSAITRLPFGPLKSAILGSIDLSKKYDQRYNLSRISAGSLDYRYTRDAAGHVTRIDGIQIPATDSASTTYSYNQDNNQLTEAAPKVYNHDANGNITSDGTNNLTYDALNRLVKVERDGAIVAVYGYDSMNRRVRKTVGETTIHYLYDANSQLIAETSADGTVQREYLYLDGEPLAMKEYQASPGVYYFINDHLGTPQRLVTASGQIVWQAAYLPFGKVQVATATVRNNLRFPGQYFDVETGLHYNWHRFFNSETGQYISADPIGIEGGMNLYAYVENDPANWVDLEGQKPPSFPYQSFPEMKRSPTNPFTTMTQNNVDTAESIYFPWTFKDKVQNKGDWDYKQYFPTWQDFGNYNYGATGAASGLFTLETLLREAGKAQCFAGTSQSGWCKQSNCDDPDDQRWIKEGWNDYWSGMYGKPNSPSQLWGTPIQYWSGIYSKIR